MFADPLYALPDLPRRLREQAENVEGDGWLNAARLMRHAADLLDQPERAATSVAPSTPAEDAA